MSKNTSSLELAGMAAFMIVVGLVAFILPEIVLAFLAPIIGWILWRDHEKIADLEKRLAAMSSEKPAQP